MGLLTIEICAGVGMLGEGLRAGLAHLGRTHRTVCYLEREAYAAAVLAARIEEGSLDAAPVWPDLLTFDGRAWRGAVDCIAAGFPCQDLSLAGRRAGLDGKRSGLFFNIVDIADDCGAQYLFLENVSGIASATASVVDEAEGALDERAAARVLGELADRGWCAEWLTLSASEVGASHGRARWFCFAWRLADTISNGQQGDFPASGEAPSLRRRSAEPCGQMDNTTSARRDGARERSAANSGSGQCLSGAGCADVDNPGRMQRRTGHEQDQPGAAEAGGHQANNGVADRSGDVVDAQCAERRALSVCGTGSQQGHDGGRPETHGGAGIADEVLGDTSLCGLFAPGPSSPRWAGIIATSAHLAPALEPAFRGVVNGLAFDMADSRAQRLKCVGNGVVALQAAAAFVVLARRAGFMRKHPPALVGIAPAAIKTDELLEALS